MAMYSRFLPGESHPWGLKELDMTERLALLLSVYIY